MGFYVKPSEKELVKNPDDFGYVCSNCGNKYRQDFSKTACETWHELEARRQE